MGLLIVQRRSPAPAAPTSCEADSGAGGASVASGSGPDAAGVDGIEWAGGVSPCGRSATGTSKSLNVGRSGNVRASNGIETLYTGTPLLVAPSSCPRCACPWRTNDTGYRLIGSS